MKLLDQMWLFYKVPKGGKNNNLKKTKFKKYIHRAFGKVQDESMFLPNKKNEVIKMYWVQNVHYVSISLKLFTSHTVRPTKE